jgi:hypothetical protein
MPKDYMAQEAAIFKSVARIATHNGLDIGKNPIYDGIIVVIDATVDPASASVVFTIQGKDPASGKYYTILASAAITGVGTTILRVDKNLTASANVVAKDVMPATFRIIATHADADSITYSVGAILI